MCKMPTSTAMLSTMQCSRYHRASWLPLHSTRMCIYPVVNLYNRSDIMLQAIRPGVGAVGSVTLLLWIICRDSLFYHGLLTIASLCAGPASHSSQAGNHAWSAAAERLSQANCHAAGSENEKAGCDRDPVMGSVMRLQCSALLLGENPNSF